MDDRRRSTRYAVRFKFVFDDGQSFYSGGVRNLSENGAYIQTALPFKVGQILRLTPVDLKDEEIFEINAKVIHIYLPDPNQTSDVGGMGVEFLDMDAESQRRLHALLERETKRWQEYVGELDPYLGVILPMNAEEVDEEKHSSIPQAASLPPEVKPLSEVGDEDKTIESQAIEIDLDKD